MGIQNILDVIYSTNFFICVSLNIFFIYEFKFLPLNFQEQYISYIIQVSALSKQCLYLVVKPADVWHFRKSWVIFWCSNHI